MQFKPADEIQHSRAPGRVVVMVGIDGAESPDEIGLPQDAARGLAGQEHLHLPVRAQVIELVGLARIGILNAQAQPGADICFQQLQGAGACRCGSRRRGWHRKGRGDFQHRRGQQRFRRRDRGCGWRGQSRRCSQQRDSDHASEHPVRDETSLWLTHIATTVPERLSQVEP
jgi:hypothetical protein